MKKKLLRLALAAAIVSLAPAQAAVDVFICLIDQLGRPVPGESVDEAFPGREGWFALKEFSMGVENPTTIGSATGGAGTGKVKFNEFTIKKTVDSVSPTLFKNLAAGSHYKTVKLAMRKSGGAVTVKSQPYLIYELTTVFTTKQDWSGPGDEGPEESISFVYAKLQISYRKQKPDGGLDEPIITGWDQVLNKADIANPNP